MQELSKAKLKLFSGLRLKKNRIRQELFLVEGKKLVEEGLQSGWHVEAILIQENKNWHERLDLEERIPVFWLSPDAYNQVNTLQNPEGIMAVIQLPKGGSDENPEISGPALILEDIQDPGNLGTILRTADWFGLEKVFCSKGTVDIYNPKVLRASMGSIFRLKVHYVDQLQSAIPENTWVAHMDGEDLGKVHFSPQDCILIGNEANGVSTELLNQDGLKKLSIPGAGRGESLNASIAGGVILWEFFSQLKRNSES